MDVKKLLKSPDTLEAVIGSTPSESIKQTIYSISDEYCHTRGLLKIAQKEKSEIARQFKDSKEDPYKLKQLKLAMTEKSEKVSSLEQSLSSLSFQATEVLDQFSSQDALPSQFQSVTKIFGQPVTFELCPPDDNRWVEFVSNHSHANAYHQPGIQSIIKECFGYSSEVLLAISENIIVGGIPLTYMRTKLFGQNAVSVPYFNYGGPLSSYFDIQQKLIEQTKDLLKQRNVHQIEIRTTQPNLYPTFSDKKVSMILSLPDSDTRLDKQLGSKVRAQINKALEHTPTARFGGLDLLDDFYKVFAVNMRDLGTPVYGKDWFKQLLSKTNIKTTLIVCYLNEQPVSCGFLLGHGQVLEIPWASTLKKVNNYNINMWMYRQILSHSIKEGYQSFDFGRSTKGASTYRFKKQWGAKPVLHYWYYVDEQSNSINDTNPDNPKFKLLIAIWKKLPVWLTKLIGPGIVKQIS